MKNRLGHKPDRIGRSFLNGLYLFQKGIDFLYIRGIIGS